MSTLHHIDIDDGSLLDLALGLTSAIERFDELIAQYAAPDAAQTEGCPCDATVHVLLGLVSLRDQLAAALAVDAPKTGPSNHVATIEGSWLR